MAWMCYELLLNLFQSLAAMLFVKSRLHLRRESRAADALCVLAAFSMYTTDLFLPIPMLDRVNALTPLVYGLLIAEDDWPIVAFWALSFTLVISLVSVLFIQGYMALMSVSYEHLMSPNLDRFLCTLTNNAALAVLLLLLSRVTKNYHYLPKRAKLVFFGIAASAYVAEEYIYAVQMSAGGEPAYYTLANGFMLLLLMLTVILFHDMTISAERESHLAAEASAFAATARHQEDFSRMYADFASRNHDMKHQIETLRVLIAKGGSREASDYLEDYASGLSSKPLFMTGCIAADALLTAKYLALKAHGIRFELTPYPLAQLPFAAADFCAVVGNLLDNALEGCLRLPEGGEEAVVRLRFARSWGMFHIVCENPCAMETLSRHGDSFRTSKAAAPDGAMHGLGLMSIRRIVEAAEGRCSFGAEDGLFRVHLMIPMAEKTPGTP